MTHGYQPSERIMTKPPNKGSNVFYQSKNVEGVNQSILDEYVRTISGYIAESQLNLTRNCFLKVYTKDDNKIDFVMIRADLISFINVLHN